MGKLVSYQEKTTRQITIELGLENSRLYRYANGRIELSKMPIGLLLVLSDYFKVEPIQLYKDMLNYRMR